MRRIGIDNPAKRGRLADEAELYHQEFKVFGHRAGHSVGGQFGFFRRRAWHEKPPTYPPRTLQIWERQARFLEGAERWERGRVWLYCIYSK